MSATRRWAVSSLIASVAAAALPTLAWSQDLPAAKAGPDPAEDTTHLDTSRDRDDHALAPVGINGQGPFQFLIDTGANISCVSRDLAEKLALNPGPPERVHTVVGVRERPSVVIDRLVVGDRTRKAVRAPTFPIAGKGVDGVLGVDWLAGQRLVLDFKAGSMLITRSRAEKARDGQVEVPVRRRLGQLTIVDADLGGERISAMIDSGSQATICNQALRMLVAKSETRRGMSVTHERIRLETVAGESFTGEQLYLSFVRLGGLRLGNLPVVYTDAHVFDLWDLTDRPAVILGMDVLRQFDAVSLDFGRSKVRFDSSELQQKPV